VLIRANAESMRRRRCRRPCSSIRSRCTVKAATCTSRLFFYKTIFYKTIYFFIIFLYFKIFIEFQIKTNIFVIISTNILYLYIFLFFFQKNKMFLKIKGEFIDLDKVLHIFYHNHHYYVISSISGLFDQSYYCEKCAIGYDHTHQHVCSES